MIKGGKEGREREREGKAGSCRNRRGAGKERKESRNFSFARRNVKTANEEASDWGEEKEAAPTYIHVTSSMFAQ